MRRLSIFVSLLLFTSTFALDSSSGAGPKVGGLCKKAGATTLSSGKKIICTKSGKKLIWRKIVKVSSDTSMPDLSTDSTPGPTPEPFKALIPISLPVAQSTDPNGITFANIMDHLADIPKVAWQRVQDVISANPSVNVPHDYFVGPNTKVNIVGGLPRAEAVLARGTKLWAGFAQTKYVSIFYITKKDQTWAEQKFHEIAIAKNYTAEFTGGFAIGGIRDTCLSSICRGARSGPITESDDSASAFGVDDAENPDTYGQIAAHEYIHNVQPAPWIGNCKVPNQDNGCSRSGMDQMFTRCWLNEGQPTAIGAMVAGEEFFSYQAMRARSSGKDSSQSITDYSEGSLKKYLFDQSAPSCYRDYDLYQLGYNVGFLAAEALVAVAGPQATMALFALGAEGQDFPTAFQNVYGISWSDASSLLAKVLAAEYAKK